MGKAHSSNRGGGRSASPGGATRANGKLIANHPQISCAPNGETPPSERPYHAPTQHKAPERTSAEHTGYDPTESVVVGAIATAVAVASFWPYSIVISLRSTCATAPAPPTEYVLTSQLMLGGILLLVALPWFLPRGKRHSPLTWMCTAISATPGLYMLWTTRVPEFWHHGACP